MQQAAAFFFCIEFESQKMAHNLVAGRLHKAESILFRCTKIRKSKSAWIRSQQSDVYVLNAPSMGH